MREKLIKTVRQYNRIPIPPNDWEKLKEIAQDCKTVKQYVYNRYGGIKSLSKLYPGYTVQNEMTKCGLREQLGLPSVYYHLGVSTALGDIKAEWSRVKSKILERITDHKNFSDKEKHYLRYVLKVNQCYESVIIYHKYELPDKFDDIKSRIPKLNNYIRRQTRKNLNFLHANMENGFHIAQRAYRYAGGGIYLTTKENRKRIFIPLTDNNVYQKQLFIRLIENENNLVIYVPINIKNIEHVEYQNKIGLSYGYHVMFTVSNGNQYGKNLSSYEMEASDRIRVRTTIRNQYLHKQKEELPFLKKQNIMVNNLGSYKLNAQKRRYKAKIESYINAEINRMLREEKPKVIYLPKLPKHSSATYNKQLNNSLSMWHRGYIKERLVFKCRQNSIELVEVTGKDISNVCAECGSYGNKIETMFQCTNCLNLMDQRENAAKNARNRGIANLVYEM